MDRQLLERLSVLPVEDEVRPHLGRLIERVNGLAAELEVVEDVVIRGRVVVPLVVMDGLEMPDDLARLHVQGDDRTGEEIVALRAVGIWLRVRGPHIELSELGIGGDVAPVTAATMRQVRGLPPR